jgi:hypothetical protein
VRVALLQLHLSELPSSAACAQVKCFFMWGLLRRIYFVFDGRGAPMTIHYRERYNIDFGRARFIILKYYPTHL